jgi:hypothetical protein
MNLVNRYVTMVLVMVSTAAPALVGDAAAKGPGRAAGQAAPPIAVGPTYDWADFDSLLARYVVNGRVNYGAWKADGGAALDKVLARAGAWADYDSATVPEKITFLTNAYNGFVIQGVLAAYPVASVKEIPGFFDRTTHAIAGGRHTLDGIEKTLLKPLGRKINDPYYHMALVCGSLGCPGLRSRAYRAATWAGDTANQAQHFFMDPAKLQYDADRNVLRTSELFDWYLSDFESGDTTLPRWIGPHLSLGVAMKMSASEPTVEFLPFDWALNDAKESK